jgi:prevent-host-death family protein
MDLEAYIMAVVTLSDAKARLSEVVRAARTRGEETIITVDGEPAARVVPVDPGPRMLTPAETASVRALMGSFRRIERPTAEFDAIELVGEGRR